jgi:hypothetical protein
MGYIRQMRSRTPTRKTKNKDRHKAFSTEPVCESLTPSQAQELLTRAQIRHPFDGEIISLEIESSNTTNNVKAKIDNVKAKIQGEED